MQCACRGRAEGVWGVWTRELVAQALGCELGSLSWSRARYRASQWRRQQGCAGADSRNANEGVSLLVGCAVAASPRGSEIQIWRQGRGI